MGAESNVGARLFLIGKDATLVGLTEIRGAVDRLNASIAAGATSSAVATAGYEEETAGLEALQLRMDTYQEALLRNAAATDAVAKVGKAAFFGLTAAAAVWTVESVRWAQNYQTQLVMLRTQAGLTVSAMNAVGRAAQANAAGLGTTPTAYLQAAYHPASTGYDVASTIAITNQGARLSAIGQAPLEDTTNALTGFMRAYGYRGPQAQHVAALLNAAVGAGNMRYSDLNAALASGMASTAKTFGISPTSVLGALAYLTDRGVPASQAGTRLRMTMSLLGAPSHEASTLLQDAGMTSTQAASSTNAMGQMLYQAGVQPTQLASALRNNSGKGGIYNALALLHAHLAGSGMSPDMTTALLSRAFGGGRMGTSIEAMYNNIPGLGQKSGQIDRNATTKRYMADWVATTKTLKFQLHELGGEVETLGIQFGTKLLPFLTTGVHDFTDLLQFLDKNHWAAIGLGTAVTAVLVPAMGLYLYRALASVGGGLKNLISGYASLIGGQSAERAALAETDASLGEATLATERLAAADEAAGGAGLGVGGGAGGVGLGGRLIGAGSLGLTGLVAGSLIRGKAGASITPGESRANVLRSFFGDTGEGALLGASIGSVIPGVGTLLGAGIGGVGGAVYSERHQIASALTTGWHDLFGGGSHTAASSAPVRSDNVNVHVYLDGKELTKSVVKQTKATVARS